MYEYIRNQITIGTDTDIIVDNVLGKYRIEIAYFKVSKDMLREFVSQLVGMSYFMYHNKLKGD